LAGMLSWDVMSRVFLGFRDAGELFHAPYRIIYRIGETRIEIVSIWHGRRALDPRELDLGELAT
jgi:plasmid stabilization system protein ParE